MDDLNMFHVLAPNIHEIGHGVRLSPQDEIASKTFVCFLDTEEELHFGFGYKNGSNFLVVCWENNIRRNKTVPKGTFIIAFDEAVTQKGRNAHFGEADFHQFRPWFNDEAQQNVKDELVSLNRRRRSVANLIERLAGLTIEEIEEVNQKIDELQGNN